MKQTKTFYLGAIIVMVMGMVCPQQVEAQVKQVGRYISDVCVATHKDRATAYKLLEDAGYEVLLNKDDSPGDYNKGVGGKYVFVGFKRTDDLNQAIVDLKFLGYGKDYTIDDAKKASTKYFIGEWHEIPHLGNSGNFMDGAADWNRILYYKKNSPLSNSKPLETLKYSNRYNTEARNYGVHIAEYVTHHVCSEGISFSYTEFEENNDVDINRYYGGDYVILLAYYHEHKDNAPVSVYRGYKHAREICVGHPYCYDAEGCNYYVYNGIGDEESPLEIESKDKLLALVDCAKLDSRMLSYHYKLTADINLEDSVGLFMKDLTFTGSLDGDGHTIRNFSTTAKGADCALFQRAEGATFKNLTIENFQVSESGASGVNNAGLCCYAKNCTFDNIKVVNGTIYGSQGGAIAYEMDGGVMTNCYASGNLYFDGGTNVGGLVGRVINTANVETRIENCSADGYIKGNQTNIGGLFGEVIGNEASRIAFSNCHSNIHVVAGTDAIGGIAAKASFADVTKCWNTGLIESNRCSFGGGLFGEIDNSTINNCYNAGDLVFKNGSQATITYGSLVGNSADNTISNSYNSGYCDGYALIANHSGTTFSNIYGVSGKCLAEAQYSQIPSGCSLFDAFDFASGKITYQMNGSTSEGDLTWYQTIGGDKSPVLTPMQDEEGNTINIVYFQNGEGCNEQALDECYTNDMNYKGHSMEYVPMTSDIKTCANPMNFDYYHCTACGKYFYDVMGKAEIDANNIIAPKAHNLLKYDMVYDCVKGGMLDHYYCEDCHNSYSSNAEPATDNGFICQNHYMSTDTDIPLTVSQTVYSGGEISCQLNETFTVNGETFKGGSSVTLYDLGNMWSYDEFTFTWPDAKYVDFKYRVVRAYNSFDYSRLIFTIDGNKFLHLIDCNRALTGSMSGTMRLTGHQPGDYVTVKITVESNRSIGRVSEMNFYFSLAERPEHVMRQYGGTYAVGNVNTCLNNSSDAAHWHCMVCNGNFSDEAGETRIGTSKPHNFTGHHEGGYFFKGDNTTLADGTQLSFAELAEDHHAHIPEYWYCADCHQNFASSNPNSDEARLNFIVQNAQHSLGSEPIDENLSLIQCECGYGKHYEYDADKAVIPVTEYDEENNALTFGDVDFTIGDDKKVMDFSPRYSYKAANATLTESWISGRTWGTKFVPFSFSTNDVPGLKFYTIKEINLESAGEGDAVIVLNEVSGNVNAGTPLFVQAVDAGITSTTISATDADLYPTGIDGVNMMSEGELYPYIFIGVTKACTITKNIKTESYYMAQDKLWHATGSFDVNPYRAYLRCNNEPDDNVVKARAFVLVTEDTPGFDRIEAVWGNGEIIDVDAVYDLSGKKLNSMQKGVNVIKLKDGSVRKVTMK